MLKAIKFEPNEHEKKTIQLVKKKNPFPSNFLVQNSKFLKF
jgi:hypothetical protein